MVQIVAQNDITEPFSEPSQTSKMNLFAKIINDFQQKALKISECVLHTPLTMVTHSEA